AKAMVGETITVRAVLTDEQFEPLDVPEVPAKLLAPSGRIDDIRLLPLKGEPRAGTYGGRFVVREAGSYELRLTLGDALDEQVLRQNVQVRLPTIELERPRRNDADLEQFAAMTGGGYLPINEETTNASITESLVSLIRPQPQTTILPGTPDVDFKRRRNAMLMWLIATMLTMEWVTRRLHRLA
ncbi:MAG: VWA domain-containing protein, partial [Pirellulales bacterium]|nr:VWA domain-containing protein [Pirellulales bacterium]